MKRNLLILFTLSISLFSTAQSILTTSESKSGILAGTDSNYAGIGYENSSDKFLFNCKMTKQDEKIKDKSIKKGHLFPHFIGLNVGIGVNVEKNKSSLTSEKKWNGGLEFEGTFFRTWDKTTNDGSSADKRIQQNTFYIKLSDAFNRIKTFDTTVLNLDTTFITLSNPIQNNFTLSLGFNWMHQYKSEWYFSYAISANVSYINKSTRALSPSNLTPFSGTWINDADSTRISQFGDPESYFSGKTEGEIFVVPRTDIFIRYRLGEKKPVLGISASYSPLLSSIKNVKIRNCIAIGPTLGLNTFPDQVLFGLMNEFIQDKKGTFKYALTFNAVFPIIFK